MTHPDYCFRPGKRPKKGPKKDPKKGLKKDLKKAETYPVPNP
jgi:hypothetical protein